MGFLHRYSQPKPMAKYVDRVPNHPKPTPYRSGSALPHLIHTNQPTKLKLRR